MEGALQCTICGSASAKYCSDCRSAYLCSGFRECYAARPSPSHYLVLYFPMAKNPGCKPELRWLYTKEIQRGYFEPQLAPLLEVPGGNQWLGRGIQIVRGNVLRGRPKFPDSLNIRYVTEYDGDDNVKVNETLHRGGEGGRCLCLDGLGETLWKGPVVAYMKAGDDFDAAKMADMTLTAYRDAIDYLAYFRETVGSMIDPIGGGAGNDHYGKLVREGQGVRINCLGDQQQQAARQEFVQVDVPKAYPLFTLEGDDPLEISECLGESWAAGATETPTGARGTRTGRSLPAHRQKWCKGSVLLVDRAKRDLDVRKVRAACRLLEERVMPLLASRVEVDHQKVLDALTEEVLEEYM
ncbi:hypothetical protein PG994_013586 [Apiospora phragmitis]|uniref:MYND-type domain-containing protein n=1 Tax=Apiospora phragmitis TaxID=2905665 RepID=A0ABR1T957_9PEZI